MRKSRFGDEQIVAMLREAERTSVVEAAQGVFMSDQLDQYKAHLQDLANIGSRHETAGGFYLSVATVLLAVLALADNEKILFGLGKELLRIVGIAGMAISALCFFQTLSLTALYSARFKRLEAMEEELPFKNFKDQYAQ
jgi:hypothetical protein